MRSQTTTWISDKLSKLFKDIVDRGLEDEALRLLKILPPPLEGMLEGGIPSQNDIEVIETLFAWFLDPSMLPGFSNLQEVESQLLILADIRRTGGGLRADAEIEALEAEIEVIAPDEDSPSHAHILSPSHPLSSLTLSPSHPLTLSHPHNLTLSHPRSHPQPSPSPHRQLSPPHPLTPSHPHPHLQVDEPEAVERPWATKDIDDGEISANLEVYGAEQEPLPITKELPHATDDVVAEMEVDAPVDEERAATQVDGPAAVEKPWAPENLDELLHAIATQDYGVSEDRSAEFATPALKAYNRAAGPYEQVEVRRAQPLPQCFAIVKVSGHE